MLSDIYSLQKEIEEEQMMLENMDRAMELMIRAVRGAGYQAIKDLNNSQRIKFDLSMNEIKITKDRPKHLSDQITLIQDVPDLLGYDCLGNPF